MDTNQSSSRNHRLKHGNVDGFITSRLHQRPIRHAPRAIYINRASKQASSPKEPKLPLVSSAVPATPQKPESLLNVTIPGNLSSKPSKTRRGLFKKFKKPRTRKQKIFLRSALVIILLFLGIGGWLGWKGLGAINKVFHGNLFSDAQALFSNTKLRGEDLGRVNILLAGNSADDPNHGGAQLTDSIMLISIDTKQHTGFMLSIPRDLWVNIPGWSHQKINAANEVTTFNQAGYPSGGMGQLEQIIQTQLGIPIDYYSLIDYTAFKDAVNAVGGITINIQSPDPRGLYDPNIAKVDGGPLLLKNGVQTLDGQTALNLARARGDPTFDGRVAYGFPRSDFNRTEHQRQMLVALEQKASSVGVLTNPIKISQLFSAIGNHVTTDMKLAEVLRLIQITKGMSVSSLQSLSLGTDGNKPLLSNYLTPNGQEALIPKAGIDNFGQIQQYYQQLTSNDPVVKEAPSVVILNASSGVGLAHKEAATLQAKGFNVISMADANHIYANNMVIDNTHNQKPASKQLLQSLFNTANTVNTSESQEAQGYSADFVLVLGQSQATAP